MKYPKERLAIHSRLKAIGKVKPTFNICDCIRYFGWGEHMSQDWQECIDSMVSSGKLTAHPNGMYSLVR